MLQQIYCNLVNIKVIWILLLIFTTCLVLEFYPSYTTINYLRNGLKRQDIYAITSLEDNFTCLSVLYGNLSETNRTIPKLSDLITDEQVLDFTGEGCSDIIQKYSFVTNNTSMSKEEEENPIAFSLLVHQNVHQVLLLLSAIYYPQNAYCIHVDINASKALFAALQNVVKCFSNVLLSTKRESVVYASFSRLQADLNCMEDLLQSSNKWNYLINLSGQDFPIKTNIEIVQGLKELNGRNKIAGEAEPNEMNLNRTMFVHRIENRTTNDGKIERFMVQTTTLKSPPPYNMTVRKNLAYNVYTRTFLHWVIFKSEKAKALLEWSRDTMTPDEHFWLMLDSQEDAPGRSGIISWSSLTPFVKWSSINDTCAGYYKHSSCVFGSEDVRKLLQQNQFFANKFDITYDSLPIKCIREWLDRKKSRTNKPKP